MDFHHSTTNTSSPAWTLSSWSAFDSLSENPPTIPHLLEVHIIVFAKEGKNHGLVFCFCPISFLNVDANLYAKILANKLLASLSSLISLDKVGFVPNREARGKTLKTLLFHHWLSTHDQNGFFLSIDRMAWDYMTEVLKYFRTPQLMPLYSSPTAQGREHGHLWDAFPIHKSTCQECPLSHNFQPTSQLH